MDRSGNGNGKLMSDRDHLVPDGQEPNRGEGFHLEVKRPGSLLAQRPRPILVVLGMHRSGTSLLSNALHVLGVDMADTTDHVSVKNPGGFWERPELVAIQDEILEAIGRPIALPSHVLPFPAAWWRSKQVQALKPKLIAYVRQQLASSENPWGFKDPRTCRLLPLWREVFRELNLEPIYVVALRRPAESSVSMSQKSAARRLSEATGELMWLSYNYDIARHVLLKSAAIVIDYDEWFADPAGVGHRLAAGLGLGELSAEEISECMASIVQSDYRHQIDNETTGIPIAGMLYKALGSGDVRALRSQVRLADLFFKSLGPIALDLDAAASERESLVVERDELAEKAAGIASLEQALHESQSVVARLEEERDAIQLQLDSTQLQLQQASEAASQSKSDLEQQAREGASLSEQLTESRARVAQLEADVADAMAERLAALGAREALQTEFLAAVQSREVAEREVKAAREAGRQGARRHRERSRALLVKAKEWRDTYKAEHGEAAGRLETARRAAELQAALESTEERVKIEQERRGGFIAALEARDAVIRELAEQHNQASAASKTRESRFAWPCDGVEGIDISGDLDKVDEAGIAGHVMIAGRPDIVPIIDVQVDGAIIFAQSCFASGFNDEGSARPWRFFIPWSRFASSHAGRHSVVSISGFDQELGRATIPADLHSYHLPPAARAAETLGGTISEAAEYHRWIVEAETPEDVKLARAYRMAEPTTWPRIHVIVYGSDWTRGGSTLRSLQEQVYGNWEAICINAAADAADVDPRIRLVDSSELDSLASEYSPDALFTFVEAGDLLAPTALLHLAEGAFENPDFALIYSDEDRVDMESGLRAMPYMKGAWSSDLALVQDYVTRLALIRRDKMEKSLPRDASEIYRLAILAGLSGSGQVIHLPFVLYHRSGANVGSVEGLSEAAEGIIESVPELAGTRLIRSDEGRLKIAWPMPEPSPCVSLIVPTRDQVELLRVCVDGFLHETQYQNLEVLIADNDSEEEATKLYLEKVATHPRVRVISCPGPFNFSKINNLAAEQAKGSLIGLMNNDLKVLDPDWLSEMVRHAVRRDVGIVGAKLLYEDRSIQHAGVTLGIALASHLYKSFPDGAEGHRGRLVLTQDVSAVTAACLLIRREVWEEVGGLDEEFPVAYNDVDLCLKVRAAGYRVLWTPEAKVYHLESRSRGKDVTPEKRERLNRDKARLVERWGDLLDSDPFHSPNLSTNHVDARLSIPPRVSAHWRPSLAAE